jgi:ketosteroid isomerase-like protein
MKRMIFLFTVAFCFSIVILGQNKEENKDQKKEQKKEEKATIEKQILINDKKLEMFSEKAKVDSLIDLYSPSCYYIREYAKRIDGRDELQKKLNSDYKSGLKITDMSLTSDDLKIYDDMAFQVGTMIIKYYKSSTSSSITETYNYSILWKKSSDGKFRIRSEIRSPLNYPCK